MIQPALFALPTRPAPTRPRRPRTDRRPPLPANLMQAIALIPDSGRVVGDYHPVGRPPNFGETLCSTVGVSMYYPEGPGKTVVPEGLRPNTCARCPFQTECMIWALGNEVEGIWALTPGERAALGGVARRRSKRPAISAAKAAIADGIDPDNLAAALRAIHPAAEQPTSRTYTHAA